jgi:hypothetical protein
MIHKVKDLSPDQRLAIEALIGRTVAEQEDISIRVLPETTQAADERRREVIEALQAHFLQIDKQRRDVTPLEADDIINEALRSTRPSYQPIR